MQPSILSDKSSDSALSSPKSVGRGSPQIGEQGSPHIVEPGSQENDASEDVEDESISLHSEIEASELRRSTHTPIASDTSIVEPTAHSSQEAPLCQDEPVQDVVVDFSANPVVEFSATHQPVSDPSDDDCVQADNLIIPQTCNELHDIERKTTISGGGDEDFEEKQSGSDCQSQRSSECTLRRSSESVNSSPAKSSPQPALSPNQEDAPHALNECACSHCTDEEDALLPVHPRSGSVICCPTPSSCSGSKEPREDQASDVQSVYSDADLPILIRNGSVWSSSSREHIGERRTSFNDRPRKRSGASDSDHTDISSGMPDVVSGFRTWSPEEARFEEEEDNDMALLEELDKKNKNLDEIQEQRESLLNRFQNYFLGSAFCNQEWDKEPLEEHPHQKFSNAPEDVMVGDFVVHRLTWSHTQTKRTVVLQRGQMIWYYKGAPTTYSLSGASINLVEEKFIINLVHQPKEDPKVLEMSCTAAINAQEWLAALRFCADWRFHRRPIATSWASGMLFIELHSAIGHAHGQTNRKDGTYSILAEFGSLYARSRSVPRSRPIWNEMLTMPVYYDDANMLVTFYLYCDKVLVGIASICFGQLPHNIESPLTLTVFEPEGLKPTNIMLYLRIYSMQSRLMWFTPWPTLAEKAAFTRNPHSLVDANAFKYQYFRIQLERLKALTDSFKRFRYKIYAWWCEFVTWNHPARTIRLFLLHSWVTWFMPGLWPCVILGLISMFILMQHPEYPSVYKRYLQKWSFFEPFYVPVVKTLRKGLCAEQPPLGYHDLIGIFDAFATSKVEEMKPEEKEVDQRKKAGQNIRHEMSMWDFEKLIRRIDVQEQAGVSCTKHTLCNPPSPESAKENTVSRISKDFVLNLFEKIFHVTLDKTLDHVTFVKSFNTYWCRRQAIKTTYELKQEANWDEIEHLEEVRVVWQYQRRIADGFSGIYMNPNEPAWVEETVDPVTGIEVMTNLKDPPRFSENGKKWRWHVKANVNTEGWEYGENNLWHPEFQRTRFIRRRQWLGTQIGLASARDAAEAEMIQEGNGIVEVDVETADAPQNNIYALIQRRGYEYQELISKHLVYLEGIKNLFLWKTPFLSTLSLAVCILAIVVFAYFSIFHVVWVWSTIRLYQEFREYLRRRPLINRFLSKLNDPKVWKQCKSPDDTAMQIFDIYGASTTMKQMAAIGLHDEQIRVLFSLLCKCHNHLKKRVMTEMDVGSCKTFGELANLALSAEYGETYWIPQQEHLELRVLQRRFNAKYILRRLFVGDWDLFEPHSHHRSGE